MDRRIALGGLAAVTAAAGVAAWFALQGARTPVSTEPPQARPAFEGIAPRLAEAARIEVRGPEATLVLVRQGEGADSDWGIEGKAMFPAKLDRVREVLAGLSELRLTEPRTANPELLERLGLEDPAKPGAKSLLLVVKDRAGASVAELVVGRRRVRTQGGVPEAVYVRRPAETQAWLAEGNLRVDADPLLWAERDLLDVKRGRVARIEGGPEADRFTLVRAAPDAALALEPVPDGTTPEQDTLDGLGRALEFFAFNDVQAASAVAGETVAGRFAVTTFDGMRVGLTLRRAGEKAFVELQAEAVPGAAITGEGVRGPDEVAREVALLNRRATGFAFEIADWKADSLLVDRASLLKIEPPAPETPATPPDSATPPAATPAPAAPPSEPGPATPAPADPPS